MQEQQTDAVAADQAAIADILGSATRPLEGTLVDFNPMESIPTLAVGDTWKPGVTVSGIFLETERLVSAKFVNSQEKEDGKGVQYRHVLKTADGKKFGIWSTGELKNTFSKLPPGDSIAILYKGKGQNAKGQQQHFFEYKKIAPATH